LDTSFQEYFASLGDDELLHIAGDRKHMREEAVLALDTEMSRRGLTRQQVLSKRRDELRWDLKDAKRRQPNRIVSKYLVPQNELARPFLGLRWTRCINDFGAA
jgi:hypothetical protein